MCSFYKSRSQKHKKDSQSSCQSFLMLLGSACVKAVGRMLVKLTPDLLSSLFLLIDLPFYLAENLCFLLSLSPLSLSIYITLSDRKWRTYIFQHHQMVDEEDEFALEKIPDTFATFGLGSGYFTTSKL